jgi:hypothetical protein
MDVVTLGAAKADAKRKIAAARAAQVEFGRLSAPPVAGRLFRPTGFANLTGNTFRRVYVLREDTTKIRLVYTNLCMTAGGEASLGTYTISAARVWFEGAASIGIPVTFAGASTIDVLQFQTVISDPISVSYGTVKGAAFAVDTYITHGAGTYLPRDANGYSVVAGIAEGYGAGDVTANNSNFANFTTHAASFGPSAIVGWGPNGHQTTAILGDSIAFGSGYGVAAGNSSFLMDALDNNLIGGLNLALAGETLALVLDFKKTKYRLNAAQGCVNVISEYGINDLTGGASVASMKSMYLQWWAILAKRFKGVFQTTIGPHASSTDNWRTLAGQGLNTEEANRQAVNQWLRAPASAGAGNSAILDAAGTLTAVFDTAKGAECNADGSAITINPTTGAISNGTGGMFPVDTTTYLTGTATSSGAQSLTDTTQAWTSQQWAGYYVHITADATTPASVGQVRSISTTTATVLNLDSAWTTNPSAGATYAIRKLPTIDGLHPSTWIHRAMATGVDATKLLRV